MLLWCVIEIYNNSVVSDPNSYLFGGIQIRNVENSPTSKTAVSLFDVHSILYTSARWRYLQTNRQIHRK